MTTRLHTLTGAAPRSSTPTQQLAPLSLRSVLSELDTLGASSEDDDGADDGGDAAAAAAEAALAKLEGTAKAIDEVAANHAAVVTFAKAERTLERGDLKGALDGFRKARQLGHPEAAECHSECGGILEELGRWSEAASEYGSALELRPRHALYHASRGYALMQLERLPAAAADFANALALDPKDEEVAEQLRSVQATVGEARLAKLLEGAEKEKERRAGRRRPCTEELAGLEAALPEAAATVVQQVGGLAVVAALVEDGVGAGGLGAEAEASIQVIYQAIGQASLAASAASAAFASRSRRSGRVGGGTEEPLQPEPEPAGSGGGGEGSSTLGDGARGLVGRRAGASADTHVQDPALQAALEKARAVVRQTEERQADLLLANHPLVLVLFLVAISHWHAAAICCWLFLLVAALADRRRRGWRRASPSVATPRWRNTRRLP